MEYTALKVMEEMAINVGYDNLSFFRYICKG